MSDEARARLSMVDWGKVSLVEWRPKGPRQNGKYVCPFCANHPATTGQEYMPCAICAAHMGLRARQSKLVDTTDGPTALGRFFLAKYKAERRDG